MVTYLGYAILESLNKTLNSIIAALPGMLYALVIILVGWILSLIITFICRKFLSKVVKLDKWLKKHELDDAMGDISLTGLLSVLLYWWIMLIFLGQAAIQLQLGMISEILLKFILWTPNLFYAILLVVGGFYFADFITDKIKKSKNLWADRIGLILEPTIVFFVAVIALAQIGINVALIVDLIRILFGALSLGIALAIGLAFGLGMKDETPKIWKSLKKEWNKQRD
ncbi:hypothetical protein JXB41_02955 [Candidatus Woesearchaeota archaeon]|nr:hypothetical protein [Candidatus Woesearchaeota archaeon]